MGGLLPCNADTAGTRHRQGISMLLAPLFHWAELMKGCGPREAPAHVCILPLRLLPSSMPGTHLCSPLLPAPGSAG